MIQKEDFYRGAAVMQVVQYPLCSGVSRHQFGYLANGHAFFYVKYSTKTASPWRLSFSDEEIKRLKEAAEAFHVFVAFVCGGDGVCGLALNEILTLLGGRAGWVSANRRHRGRYEVHGAETALQRRVPQRRWPELLFGIDEVEDGN
jgi:hypothetical protein